MIQYPTKPLNSMLMTGMQVFCDYGFAPWFSPEEDALADILTFWDEGLNSCSVCEFARTLAFCRGLAEAHCRVGAEHHDVYHPHGWPIRNHNLGLGSRFPDFTWNRGISRRNMFRIPYRWRGVLLVSDALDEKVCPNSILDHRVVDSSWELDGYDEYKFLWRAADIERYCAVEGGGLGPE